MQELQSKRGDERLFKMGLFSRGYGNEKLEGGYLSVLKLSFESETKNGWIFIKIISNLPNAQKIRGRVYIPRCACAHKVYI